MIPPPIFVASDTFGPIFHADMVQARLISLCDRCDGDSSAVIIETQPPLWRIAGYLSFMQRKGGRKTNNHRCMDLCPLFRPLRFLPNGRFFGHYNIDERLLIPRK